MEYQKSRKHISGNTGKKGHYWLGSIDVYPTDGHVRFSVRYVYKESINSSNFYGSEGLTDYSYYRGVRVAVTLKSNIEIEGEKDGQEVTEYIIK